MTSSSDSLQVACVILFVKDMQAMFDFYAEVLGLRLLDGSDSDFRILDAGGVQLALHQIPARFANEIRIDSPPTPRADVPTKMVFRAEDVVAARDVLIGHGARMLSPMRSGDLVLCDGIDPEGNVFQISNRP